jgi:hypothetical protein
VNDQIERKDEESDDPPPAVPGVEPPPAPTARPTLTDFDRWIQKGMIAKMGAVIVIAFLVKTFAPTRFAFSLGLLAGVTLLALLYLLDVYQRSR